MSLLELIERADERALAAAAVACLDRCLPLLAGVGAEPLRPLWAGCEDGRDWANRLTAVRTELGNASEGASGDVSGRASGETVDTDVSGRVSGETAGADDPATLVRAMLAAAPSDFAAPVLREWADACSLVALRVHGRFDAPDRDAPADEEHLLKAARNGEPAPVGPLVAGELARQARILEILAETSGTTASGAGLRKALDLSTEGRRVLRAVTSRRARGRG
ncbi:hypothetical protein ACIODW_25015 [Streptomyces sp. NPDC087897]|uniref:hypothetical protein n=1 Tax=Streptomyces sp. NPDC087897 TaxID=3365817 RepID=UPI00382E1B14